MINKDDARENRPETSDVSFRPNRRRQADFVNVVVGALLIALALLVLMVAWPHSDEQQLEDHLKQHDLAR